MDFIGPMVKMSSPSQVLFCTLPHCCLDAGILEWSMLTWAAMHCRPMSLSAFNGSTSEDLNHCKSNECVLHEERDIIVRVGLCMQHPMNRHSNVLWHARQPETAVGLGLRHLILHMM